MPVILERSLERSFVEESTHLQPSSSRGTRARLLAPRAPPAPNPLQDLQVSAGGCKRASRLVPEKEEKKRGKKQWVLRKCIARKPPHTPSGPGRAAQKPGWVGGFWSVSELPSVDKGNVNRSTELTACCPKISMKTNGNDSNRSETKQE